MSAAPNGRPLRGGDALENPVTGERLVFRKTGHETGGEYIVADYFLRAGGGVPALHLHPRQVEVFEVISGTVTFQLGDERERVGPGARREVPMGTPHGVYNETGEECHVMGELRPALRTDELMQTVWGLAADGRTNGDGVPNLLQSIAVAKEFRAEIELVSPPRAVQRVAIPLLAPVARALRYSGTYVPRTASS